MSEIEDPKADYINELNSAKVVYFLYGVYYCSWYRFSVIYLTKINLSVIEIGYIESISFLVATLAGPVTGILADKIGSKNKVLSTITLIATISMLLISFPVFQSFTLVLLIIVIYSFCDAWSLIDSYIIDLVYKISSRWGESRLYLSVAWGLTSIIAGYLIDLFDSSKPISFLICTSGLIVFYFLKKHCPEHTDNEKSNKKSNNSIDFDRLKKIIFSDYLIFLAFGNFFALFLFTAVQKYAIYFLVQELHGKSWVAGVSGFNCIILEAVLFNYSEKIQSKFNYYYLYLLSLMFYCIRYYLLTLLTSENYYLIIFIELLHGPSLAFNRIGLITFTKERFPSEVLASVISIVNAIGNGLGSATATFVGSKIINDYSCVVLFQTCYFLSIAVAIVFYLIYFYHFKKKEENINLDNSNVGTQLLEKNFE